MAAKIPLAIADEWRWIQRKLAPYASLQTICTAYLLGASVLGLADPLIIRWIIDHGLRQMLWTPILLALGLLLVLFGIRSALLFVGNMMSASILLRWTFKLRLDLFEKLKYSRWTSGNRLLGVSSLPATKAE